jgi:hypothetical protein
VPAAITGSRSRSHNVGYGDLSVALADCRGLSGPADRLGTLRTSRCRGLLSGM